MSTSLRTSLLALLAVALVAGVPARAQAPFGLAAADSPPALQVAAISAQAFAAATSPHAAVQGQAGPETFALQAPYPNPFHAEVTVRYSLAETATIRLEAYDALGRRVAMLAEGVRAAGSHAATLDGSALAPGLYLVRLTASGASGERTATRRIVKLP
jgi:hypothetical protein